MVGADEAQLVRSAECQACEAPAGAAVQVLAPLDQDLMLTPSQAKDLTLTSYASLMGLFMQGGALRKPGGPLAWGKTQSRLLAEVANLTLQVPELCGRRSCCNAN